MTNIAIKEKSSFAERMKFPIIIGFSAGVLNVAYPPALKLLLPTLSVWLCFGIVASIWSSLKLSAAIKADMADFKNGNFTGATRTAAYSNAKKNGSKNAKLIKLAAALFVTIIAAIAGSEQAVLNVAVLAFLLMLPMILICIFRTKIQINTLRAYAVGASAVGKRIENATAL
jgi:hypothetical protein